MAELVKAYFTDYNEHNQGAHRGWNWPIPVMINPAEINHSISANAQTIKGMRPLAMGERRNRYISGATGNWGTLEYDTPPVSLDLTPQEDLSLTLHFDLATPYETWLRSGANRQQKLGDIVGFSNGERCLMESGKEETTAIDGVWSLENEKICIIPFLKSWTKNSRTIRFYWGDMDFVGVINSLSCKYNYFTRWGTPLRGDADVKMIAAPKPCKDVGTIFDRNATSADFFVNEIKTARENAYYENAI